MWFDVIFFMFAFHNRKRGFGSLPLALFAGWLMISDFSSLGQTVTLNVTNFGARGDAVQFWVNTTSNSLLVTTTNQLSSAAIGDAIEVFQAGSQTYGVNSYGINTNGNQDLMATIVNIVDGTNIYLSQPAQSTLTNTFATYGHDNQTNFQNAIAAASGTNTIINVPAGVYLILGSRIPAVYGFVGISIQRGGISLVGAGSELTTLLGQGAWSLQSGAVTREFLLDIIPPITNDYPFNLENMTLDGGVQQGNTLVHGTIANVVDGCGWDQTHDAVVIRGGSGNVFTHQTWSNVVFQHWRGEMVKSNDGSTNGNLNIFNCYFNDGNATAINIYPSLNISNCVFENLFQVAEYYQAYSTNTNYFQYNYITNITGNGFALNGGSGRNPPFVIQGNIFYFPGNGYNGIETTPADNVLIISNQFWFQQNGGNAFDLGCPGYQGTFDNSNIVIADNRIWNASTVVEISGGVSSTGPNRVESVSAYGNVVEQATNGVNLLQTFGWSTNIHFSNNDCSAITNSVGVSSGIFGGIYTLIDIDNLYYNFKYDLTGITNYISYGTGSKYKVVYYVRPTTVYALQDSDASQIPVGAQIFITNATAFPAGPFPLYLNSALTSGPLTITNGQSTLFTWTNNAWQPATMISATGLGFVWTNGAWAPLSEVTPPTPPTDLHVIQISNGP